MKLVVHELVTELKQKITATVDQNVYSIRPHLYKNLAPAGSLTIEVRDENDLLIAESSSLSIGSIPSGNYYHGYVEFMIDCQMKANTDYYVALVPNGYTFSDSAFIGWCNDFDLSKYASDDVLAIGANAPLDMEIWAKREQGRAYT
jgi:hypothetical protein